MSFQHPPNKTNYDLSDAQHPTKWEKRREEIERAGVVRWSLKSNPPTRYQTLREGTISKKRLKEKRRGICR